MQSRQNRQHDDKFTVVKIEEQDTKVHVKTNSVESSTNRKSALYVNDAATCSTLNECQVKSKNINR